MRRAFIATLFILVGATPVTAEQKPPQPQPPHNFVTVEETFAVDIPVDEMEKKLIEQGKHCNTKASTAWTKSACRQEYWTIFSTRALMKFTCVQAIAGLDTSVPNSSGERLAKECIDMVRGTDNFIHEVFGVSRDSPAPTK